MSGQLFGKACECKEMERKWKVFVRRGNFSAFNGYKFTHSDYSEVGCLKCGSRWRTKAQYVADLPNATKKEKMRA